MRGVSPGCLLATAGFAAWLVLSAASQHPDRNFDRMRKVDPTRALIPDWRFFAPNPAQHDVHVLYRVVLPGGETSEWALSSEFAIRSWSNFAWLPDRRRDKGLFDICIAMGRIIQEGGAGLTEAVPYQLLRNFVARTVSRRYVGQPRPLGFQFAMVRHTGYDEEPDLEYLMVSPYVGLAG
jgi:hypothetical protein